MNIRINIDISPSYSELRPFIDRIPTELDAIGSLIYSGRNALRSVHLDNGLEIVIKRYHKPNIFQRITYSFFGRSKAAKAMAAATMLKNRGFLTPEAIASIEIYRGTLISEYYFVCLHTSSAPLYPILVNSSEHPHELIRSFAKFLVRLHKSGTMHGDLNLNNILVTPDNCFELIDTNRSQFLDSEPSKNVCLNNLTRLTHNRFTLYRILKAYAETREWEPQVIITTIFHRLRNFERRRSIKHFFKRLI